MNLNIFIWISLFIVLPGLGIAQNKVVFDGQLSAFDNFAPDNDLDYLLGARYIPELSYSAPIDSSKTLDFFASANIYGSANFHPFDTASYAGDVQPYRIWARFTGNQYEVRVGLQKIDFGVATILRPLQWFNQVDPRDPLGITNGLYGALGRYYFLNNANIWLWALYGNDDPKGFEIIGSNGKIPEFGGRVQYPVPKGEIALTYHHRVADSQSIPTLPQYEKIPENRFGFDAKWDVTIGLWVEASHINKSKNLGIFTNQTLINIGMDYTFGVGNGMNFAFEHLISAVDEKAFKFEKTFNISATTLAYPLGFFDNLSAVSTFNWETKDASFFLNYEHQFSKFAGYVMLFYNPDTPPGFIENDIENTLKGPGLRLMLVYNH
ncbi:MAG: hypothetical protein KTR26_03525 [Flammeovirgaceae bacterium]|nr:hypothetical protein [Flammeovirgaceae bacterium]